MRDLKNIKKEFPIFRRNPNLIYLDSAATSQKPQYVLDEVMKYYSEYNANIHRGIYSIAEKATAKVEEVRKKVASFINAQFPEEVIFTKGTTEAINLVMYSWGKEFVNKDDIVMTTIMEHHANFVPWQMLVAEKNALLSIVNITEDGLLDADRMIEDAKSAKLLAFSYASNMLGTINDVNNIVTSIRESNPDIKILIDAAQAVPHMNVDVQKLDCDFLVFSGHKMLAETGVGVLYAKKELLEEMQPFLFGGDMIREVTREGTSFADIPSKFEGGTINIAGVISLGAAIGYLGSIGMENVRQHESKLVNYCVEEMKKIEGTTIYGPEKKCGIVSFTMGAAHPHDIAQILADEGICVRSGHHCAMPLHRELGIPASTRASFYIYNDEDDVEKFINGIKKVKKLFH